MTSVGRRKAEELTGSGPKSQVMTLLYERDSMDVSEIAAELDMDETRVAMIVRGLMRDGYVQKASSGGFFSGG